MPKDVVFVREVTSEEMRSRDRVELAELLKKDSKNLVLVKNDPFGGQKSSISTKSVLDGFNDTKLVTDAIDENTSNLKIGSSKHKTVMQTSDDQNDQISEIDPNASKSTKKRQKRRKRRKIVDSTPNPA